MKTPLEYYEENTDPKTGEFNGSFMEWISLMKDYFQEQADAVIAKNRRVFTGYTFTKIPTEPGPIMDLFLTLKAQAPDELPGMISETEAEVNKKWSEYFDQNQTCGGWIEQIDKLKTE